MLKYKLYKDTRSNSQFKGCWYARIAKSDIITTRQLVAHMTKHGTAYSKGTMWAVITDMITCVHELILRGQAVKIDDLAIFSIGIVRVANIMEATCYKPVAKTTANDGE